MVGIAVEAPLECFLKTRPPGKPSQRPGNKEDRPAYGRSNILHGITTERTDNGARRKNVDVCKMQPKKPFHCVPPHTMVRQSGSLCHYSPSSDISGTVATKGPSGNLGGLSLMSWTLMMNSDFGSSASSVLRSKACACRT